MSDEIDQEFYDAAIRLAELVRNPRSYASSPKSVSAMEWESQMEIRQAIRNADLAMLAEWPLEKRREMGWSEEWDARVEAYIRDRGRD